MSCAVTRSGCSLAALFAGFSNKSDLPLRTDVKMMRLPSGDQTALPSLKAPNVNRFAIPWVTSISHTLLTCTPRLTATRRPSGASSGLDSDASSGIPITPIVFPVRSTQTSCRRASPPRRYASTTFVTENAL